MKKIAILFCAILLVVSCKQNMEEHEIETKDYGTVVLDFTNKSYNLRTLGSNGLPELKNSEMKLIIQEGSKSPIEKLYSDKEEKKYEGKFPIGTNVELTVIVMGKGGKWKGQTSLKVQKGDNSVHIKLKKSATSLEALKFQLDKNVAGQGELTFKLGFAGGTPFFSEEVSSKYEDVYGVRNGRYTPPSFCRDRMGRIYILYAIRGSGGTEIYHLKRFTSEGDLDSSFSCDISSLNIPDKHSIISDYVNDNIYILLNTVASKPKVVPIVNGELKTGVELPVENGASISAIAVYNDIFLIAESGNSTKLGLYKYENGSIQALQSRTELTDADILMNTKIEDFAGRENNERGVVRDLYMKEDSIYVLYSFRENSKYPSFGGILKYNYSIEGKNGKIEGGERLVGKPEYRATNRVAGVMDENNELFGALRFVGFSEDELYLADDGAKYEYDAGVLNNVQNKNRLISLDLNKNKLYVKDENIESWLPETEAINKNIEPLLFYNLDTLGAQPKYSFSIYTEGDAGLSPQVAYTSPVAVETAFFNYTFDGMGNFYLVDTNKISKYVHGKDASYKVDNNFVLTAEGGASWRDVLYDTVASELYLVDSAGFLYRHEDLQVKKIEKNGLTILPEKSTIYDNKLYMFNESSGNIEVYKVNADDISSATLDTMDSLKSELKDAKLERMASYNNSLFIFYSKGDERNVYLAGLNLENRAVKHEMLHTRGSKIENYLVLGFNKAKKEIKFPIDSIVCDYDGRNGENENKYASISMKGNELNIEFHDVPAGIKWNYEWKKWAGTKDIMLFDNVSGTSYTKPVFKAQYYSKAEDKLNEALTQPSLTSNPDQTSYSSFCYDQLGNLYVLYKKTGSYRILKVLLENNGRYNFDRVDSNFMSLSMPIDASSSEILKLDRFVMTATYLKDEGKYSIYYALRDSADSKTIIKKHEFLDSSFDTSTHSTSWSLAIDDEKEDLSNGWKVKREVVAMTANKDGLFIAEREVEQKTFPSSSTPIEKTYAICVKKYSHADASLLSTIYLVGKDGRVATNMYKKYGDSELTEENATWDECIKETVANMYAYNGVLYALTCKIIGAEDYDPLVGGGDMKHTVVSSSGTIWKVGSDTAKFEGDAISLHSSKNDRKESGKFCPHKIIGILPRKLVIASDGFYGEAENKALPANKKGLNYNSVLMFDLDAEETTPTVKETKARFSFKLPEGDYTSSYWNWE